MCIHDWIVDELAEHGHRLAHCGRMSGTEGVTDAEAHAMMLSEMEVHRL